MMEGRPFPGGSDQEKIQNAARGLIQDPGKAVVIVKIDHGGNAQVSYVGSLFELSFCAKSLDWFITEMISGRLQVPQAH